MIRKKIGLFALALVALVIGIWLGFSHFSPERGGPNSVQLLFAQQWLDAAGQTHPLARYRGKILVVNFWASWCAPCVEEIPEFSHLQLQYPQVQFLGIGVDSSANIVQFSRKTEITYPLLVAGAPGLALARELGNAAGAIPFTLLVDAQGHIHSQYLGRVSREQVEKDLRLLMMLK